MKFERLSIKVALCLVSIVVALALVEGGLRWLGPADGTSLEAYLSLPQRSPGQPRLFPEGFAFVADIRGLYEGGTEVTFDVGPSRFINPEPKGDAEYRVLCIGGSTTECIYLNAEERWPALLNVPGVIDTCNAGMSESGMLAQLLTLEFLADRGDRFDLVVLMSQLNDTAWSRRFSDLGLRYRQPEFLDGLHAVYESDYGHSGIARRGSPFRIVDVVERLLRERSPASANAEAPAEVAAPAEGAPPSTVVATYLAAARNGQVNESPTAECLAELDRRLARHQEIAAQDWSVNMRPFRLAAERLGAKLLVLSEASSFLAPAESFYFADLRVFWKFPEACGLVQVSPEEHHRIERENALAYLQAAEQAGALTFDLSAAIDPFSNGPEGGSYMYDGVHYTPRGAAMVAEILRPVIADALGLDR